MVDSSDKRDFKRMTVDCAVKFKSLESEHLYDGVAKDLSASGIALYSQQSFSVGDKLEVFVRPDKQVVPPLDAVVEVMRVDALPDQRYLLGCVIREMRS